MARWATVCEIAGVVFTGCRAEVIDGVDLLTGYAGSVDWGNSGNPVVTVFNSGVIGKMFGLQFASMEIADHLEDVLTAVEAAEAANSTFVVETEDGVYSINANCIKDYTQQWLTHGKHSEGFYETVVMRFIIKSPVS